MIRGIFFLKHSLAPLTTSHPRHHSTFERLLKATVMTSPSTIAPKFLSTGNELGVVAVGFSGGQVSTYEFITTPYKRTLSQCLRTG